ncbi:MAG: MoxR family ATPase [Pseudomonadota bacterium]
MTNSAQALEQHIVGELSTRLFGMEEVMHALTIALINGGHVLLEGPPGLGKTRLSKAFAAVLGGAFKRVQGTADLMPTDITGVHVFNTQQQEFEFQPGPLFADIVLVDEINRAGPKTQSALLEAMEERQVTVDRDTFPLARNFLVVATQNPREFEGTFPLPESQLDRFSLSVPIHYIDRDHEQQILMSYSDTSKSVDDFSALNRLGEDAVAQAQAAVDTVSLSDKLTQYVIDIATATREHQAINLGLSTRAALTLTRCARVEAALRGGEFVIPDDVQRVTPWVMAHRLVLTPEAALDGTTTNSVVDNIMQMVEVPK